jgi:hypothetical protein
VVPHLALDVGRARVLEAALREHDRPAGEDARVVGVVVALRVAELLLCPRRAVVVGLPDVEVAALRAVPRDVDVLAGRARGDLGLVGPRDVSVDVHRLGPGPPVVGRLGEDGREAVVAVAVQENRVDGAGVRHDLDGRVVLGLRAEAEAERHLRAERRAAVRRPRQGDERRGAVARAARRRHPVPRREEVDVGRRGIGRDRRLPVVGRGVQELGTDPTGRRSRRPRHRAAEEPACPRLGERLQACGGDLVFLLRLQGPRPRNRLTGRRRAGRECVRERRGGRERDCRGEADNQYPALQHGDPLVESRPIVRPAGDRVNSRASGIVRP